MCVQVHKEDFECVQCYVGEYIGAEWINLINQSWFKSFYFNVASIWIIDLNFA